MLLIVSDPVRAGDQMTRGDDGSENRRLSDGRPEHLSADLQQQTSLGRNFALEGVILIIGYIEHNQEVLIKKRIKFCF